MISRASDKKISKKSVSVSQTPSVGNVSLIGKSTFDISKATINGQSVGLTNSTIQVISDVVPGTASAGKVVVVDANKDVNGIEDIDVDELYVNGDLVTGIVNTGATVSDSAFMNDIQPGSHAPGKIMSIDSNLETKAGELSIESLNFNSGVVSAPTCDIYDNIDTNILTLYDTPKLYLVDSAAGYISVSINAHSYSKIGSVYMMFQESRTNATWMNNSVILCQNIYAAGGGTWSQSFSSSSTLFASNCFYDSALDRHFVPVIQFDGSSTLSYKIYVSPTGDPSTWTGSPFTGYTLATVNSSVSSMNYSSWPLPSAPSVRRFGSKIVMLSVPAGTLDAGKRLLSALYGSTDGTTWAQISTVPGGVTYNQMVVSSTHIIVMTNGPIVQYSTNGTTWNSKTTATSVLSYENYPAEYFQEIDTIYCHLKVKTLTNFLSMAANAEFNEIINGTEFRQGYPWTYDPDNDIYFTQFNINTFNYIYSPITKKITSIVGYYVGGYVLLPSYITNLFTSSVSFRFTINQTKTAQLQRRVIVDPSTYLTFEANSSCLIYDFVWCQAIGKYIVIGKMHEGFPSAYSSETVVCHSVDLETFTFVSVSPAETVRNLVYNEALNALHMYTFGSAQVYNSLDYGATFIQSNVSGAIDSFCYVPLIKSTIICSASQLRINYKNPTAIGTASNCLLIEYSGSFISYIEETMAVRVVRGTGAVSAYGHLFAFMQGYSTTNGLYRGMMGFFYADVVTGTTTAYPRHGKSVTINKYIAYTTDAISHTSIVGAGSQFSNIEYIDPLKIFVAFRTADSASFSTSRFVYSYDKKNWFEPLLNGLNVNTTNISSYSLKYDKKSGYLFALGSNGSFRTVHSTKGLVISRTPLLISKFSGATTIGSLKSNEVFPFTSISQTTNVTGLAYCRGTYIACKTNDILYGPGFPYLTSTNTSGTWTSATASTNLFLVVGTNKVASSGDGITWSSSSMAGSWTCATWSSLLNQFAIVGTDKVAWSDDGTTWSQVTLVGEWKSIKYLNGLWVLVGNNKVAYTTSSLFAPTVVAVTGNWYDVAFGGQWVLAGSGCIALSDKITSITPSVVTKSYNRVDYSEVLRSFIFTGTDCSTYSQITNLFSHYSQSLTTCKWFWRTQCFIGTTSSGIMSSQPIGTGLDTGLCVANANFVVTRSSGSESSFNITDSGNALSTNTPFNVSSNVADTALITFKNNSDGTSGSIVNRTSFINWEAPQGINLDILEDIKVNNDAYNSYIYGGCDSIAALSIDTMGTAQSDSYLSLDYSGNMTAGSINVGGLIVNGELYAGSTPSSLTGVTQGVASASKALMMNSSKEVIGINRLTTESMALGLTDVVNSPPHFSVKYDSSVVGNTPGGNSHVVLSVAYNDVLGIYAAVVQYDATVSTAYERAYILVSKDCIEWKKAYLGTKSMSLHIQAVKPGSPLRNSFGLTNVNTGFIILLHSNNHICKSLFTPDCINFYYTNMTGSQNAFDLNVISDSIVCVTPTIGTSSLYEVVLINNGRTHPNRFQFENSTGLNQTYSSSTTENNYIWAMATSGSAGMIFGVTPSAIVIHSSGSASTVTTIAGETLNAACGFYNQSTGFLRIICTASGKIYYGTGTATSTAYTVASGVSLKCCAYNPTTNRFCIGAANGKIYVSAVGSVTTWTEITIPVIFNGVSWSKCVHAYDKGFVLSHTDTAAPKCYYKIVRVTENDTLSYGISNYDTMGFGAGCYGNGYYVIGSYSWSQGSKILYSRDGLNWKETLYLTSYNQITLVVWTGSFFVASNNGRTLYISSDLINWTTWTNPVTSVGCRRLRYCSTANKVVAVFSGTGSNLAWSSDGVTWTTVVIPQMPDLQNFAYSQSLDKYVFVSYSDKYVDAVVSSDLQTFTTVQSTEATQSTKITGATINWFEASGAFIMCGDYQWRSYDGLNWERLNSIKDYSTAISSGTFANQNIFTSIDRYVAYVPGVGDIVSYGLDPRGSYLLSINNESVKHIATLANGGKTDCTNLVIYNPDSNCILAYRYTEGGESGNCFTIVDLSENTQKTNREVPMDYIAKLYPSVAPASSALASTNLKTLAYTLSSGPSTNSVWNIHWSNALSRFVIMYSMNRSTAIVQVTADTQQYYSMDGYVWAADTANSYTSFNATSRANPILKYIEVPGMDYLVTVRNTAYMQIFGQRLAPIEQGIAGMGEYTGVSYLRNKQLIAIGNTQMCLSFFKNDGTVYFWKYIPLPSADAYNHIVECNGVYLAFKLGSSNTYYYSSDLYIWTAGTLPDTSIWTAVSELDGKRVVAASWSGKIAYTNDGINWTTVHTSSSTFMSLKYFKEYNAFIACSYSASSDLIVSTDNGLTFSAYPLGQTLNVSDIAYSPLHDRFVLITATSPSSTSFSVTVSLPLVAKGGNVLRLNAHANPALTTFGINHKGGIYTGARMYGGSNFNTTTTENPPLISLETDGAYKPATNSWTIFSDARLKKNISKLDDDQCLEIVKALPLKHYKWKDQFAPGTADRHKLGWIAQDVQELIPTAIRTLGSITLEDGTVIDNLKTISTDQILVLMHGAIRALVKRYQTISETLQA